MYTWTATIKNLSTGVEWTVSVTTETNYRAAAKVRALGTMYSGLDWKTNLVVTSVKRSSGKAA